MAKAKAILLSILCLIVCNGLFGQRCIVEKAKDQIGVKEKGDNRGAKVSQYLASTGLEPGYAWCAASINWIYQQCDVETPDSKAAWSPAWFPTDKTIYKHNLVEAMPPQPGDVFGIYFSSKGRIAHVGIIERQSKGYFITLEGNTNKAGGREGQGYYRKRRPERAVDRVSRWQSRCK